LSTRRRIYLLRHAEVVYFDADGQPVAPDEVPLTPAGRHQAGRAGAALAGVRFDRVLTSGLPRTVETARLVLAAAAAAGEPRPSSAPPVEEWPELRELAPGRLADLAPEELEAAFLGAFRGVLAGPTPTRTAASWSGRSTPPPGIPPTWPAARPPWRSSGPSTGALGRLDRRWPTPGG
jgi:broad specificity phosphatase PhoE